MHGMILDKSLMIKLSRMTHSYRANISSISTLDRKGYRYCQEKDDRNWLHVDSNNNRSWLQRVTSLWEVVIIIIINEIFTNVLFFLIKIYCQMIVCTSCSLFFRATTTVYLQVTRYICSLCHVVLWLSSYFRLTKIQ